jgi:hypothetical protein
MKNDTAATFRDVHYSAEHKLWWGETHNGGMAATKIKVRWDAASRQLLGAIIDTRDDGYRTFVGKAVDCFKDMVEKSGLPANTVGGGGAEKTFTFDDIDGHYEGEMFGYKGTLRIKRFGDERMRATFETMLGFDTKWEVHFQAGELKDEVLSLVSFGPGVIWTQVLLILDQTSSQHELRGVFHGRHGRFGPVNLVKTSKFAPIKIPNP